MTMQRRISASSFRSLLHCPHALFLDHHGDPSLKTELGEFETYLLDEGNRFEQQVIEGQIYAQPEYPEGDLDAGYKATLDLMAQGHDLIYQGVLMTDRYIGIPDLLVKKQGKSNLGGWHYEPREIKTARSVKDFHILQLSLYASMLETIQGERPKTASVVLADESEEVIKLDEEWQQFEKRLAEAIAVVNKKTKTDFAIFSGCKECPWQDVCYKQAVDSQDVTLVAGLRRGLKPQLNDAGILTVPDIARSDADTLVEFRGIGEKTAEKLVLQAKSQMTGKVIRLKAPKLSKSSIELYYDIESEASLDCDYLHGLLIVEKGGKDRYLSFVADNPDQEEQAFREFIKTVKAILDKHPKTPIYHYHSYERTHVHKLFEKYPGRMLTEDELMGNFVDLHRVLTESFVLPVEGYGLKPVSKYLGFEYRNTKSSAVQSILWYRLWLDRGNRQYLDDSIIYNEDDCRATKMIMGWVGSA